MLGLETAWSPIMAHRNRHEEERAVGLGTLKSVGKFVREALERAANEVESTRQHDGPDLKDHAPPESPDSAPAAGDELLSELLELGREITAALVEDLREYPEHELKRRYVESEVTLDERRINALRAAARKAGATLATGAARRLAIAQVWQEIVNVDSLPSEPSLREIPAVREIIVGLDRRVEELAAEYGLPCDERDPPGYRASTGLISGKHLPALVRRYCGLAHRIRTVRDGLTEVQERARKKSKADQWK
ncbi:MAG: hypothetical protein HYV63_26235 [Candidatus Schekmanbacteria bacterium]|nr:hypothetical protein [Candidatus Schekmanbacteria bacterium]